MATQNESLDMMNRVQEHLGDARVYAALYENSVSQNQPERAEENFSGFEESMVQALREVGRFTKTQLAQSLGELEKKGLVKPYRDGDNTVRYSLTEKRP